MADRTVEISDLDPVMRQALAECELTGRRSLFMRGGRIVATVLSWDEYLALRETVALGSDQRLHERLERRNEQIRANDLLAPEDLFVE